LRAHELAPGCDEIAHQRWLEARDIDVLDGVRGKMRRGAIRDPAAFDRANYIAILQGYNAA
jgi:hypothetical protein